VARKTSIQSISLKTGLRSLISLCPFAPVVQADSTTSCQFLDAVL